MGGGTARIELWNRQSEAQSAWKPHSVRVRSHRLRCYSLNAMAIIILRFVFLMVAAGIGVRLINSAVLPHDPAWIPWLVFTGIMLLSAAVIALDMFVPRKRLETISAVY